MDFDHAREIVDSALRDILGTSTIFQGDERLVNDLRVDSDDLSFLFVPAIERAAKIRPPAQRWRSVFTVNDAARLIVEFAKPASE